MVSKDLKVYAPSRSIFNLNPPILSYSQSNADASQAHIYLEPFKVFRILYSPSVTNEFARIDNMHVYTQLNYPPKTNSGYAIGDIEFEFNVYNNDDELIKKMTHIIPQSKTNAFGVAYVSRQIPLDDMPDGDYRLEIMASESSQGATVARTAFFSVKEPSEIARPSEIRVPRRDNVSQVKYLELRGDQYAAAGHIDRAIVEYSVALKNDREHVGVSVKLGRLLLQKGKTEDAVRIVRAVEWKDPNNKDIITFLAEASVKSNNIDQAIGFYERYLFVNPEDTTMLNLVANLYKNRGDNEKARDRWRKSLEIKPDQPDIKALLEKN
jgi:tetratricopeptide (TPR) repeat protein